jgi:hypothetical protein
MLGMQKKNSAKNSQTLELTQNRESIFIESNPSAVEQAAKKVEITAPKPVLGGVQQLGNV